MRAGRMIGTAVAALAATAAGLWSASPAAGNGHETYCIDADAPAITAPPHAIRFGITPRLAGSAGAIQEEPAPEDTAAIDGAVADLRGDGVLVLRLNRLFWADGAAGIEEFGRLVDRFAALGARSEIQVRYHPPEGREGDIAGFEAFVRDAVRALGPKPSVVGFSITNEANLPISPNTSDGAYEGVEEALVRGVIAAREEGNALGRPGLDIGFNVMWRWAPDSDRRFWREVGRLADLNPAFRPSLDYVGLQVYPGLVWPPVPWPHRPASDEVIEGLTLLRRCFMPQAGLGDDIDVWVSENGYATNLGRSESQQVVDLRGTVAAVHAHSGTLGVTDYRWFNLRDNDSDGRDLFSAVGLMRDDHSRKPSFEAYREEVAARGVAP